MIDTEAMRREIAARLPRRAKWTVAGMPLSFDFTRALQALRSIADEDVYGEIDEDWRSLAFFGERDYADGGGSQSLLGVHRETGQIFDLDVENDEPLVLLNSSAEAFIRTFELFDAVLRLGARSVGELEATAPLIDPAAYAQSEWPMLLEMRVES